MTRATDLVLGKRVTRRLKSSAEESVDDSFFQIAKDKSVVHLIASEPSIVRQLQRFRRV